MQINQENVGRIAERIIANELEARGFGVSDLNSSRRAAPNADLLAVSRKSNWLFQVKGSANGPKDAWWVNYGFCTQKNIDDRSQPMFNRRDSFYEATHVALVAVRMPTLYTCIILPVDEAERAAQMNLDRYYRKLSLSGQPRKPHKVWVGLEPPRRPRNVDDSERAKERRFLTEFRDEEGWKKLAEQVERSLVR
jgi:hypothetical protein